MRPNRGKMCLHAPKKGCRQPTGFLTLLLADDFFMLILSKNRSMQLRNELFAAAFNRTFGYWNRMIKEICERLRKPSIAPSGIETRQGHRREPQPISFNRTFGYWNQFCPWLLRGFWWPSIAPSGIETWFCREYAEWCSPPSIAPSGIETWVGAVHVFCHATFNRTFGYWNDACRWRFFGRQLCLQSHLRVLKRSRSNTTSLSCVCLQSHLRVLKLWWAGSSIRAYTTFNRTFGYWNTTKSPKVSWSRSPSIAPSGIETLRTKQHHRLLRPFNRTFGYWNFLSQTPTTSPPGSFNRTFGYWNTG